MLGDGHDIPWQSLWGYGDLIPTFDIDLPENLFEPIRAILSTERFARYDSEMKPKIPYPGRVKMVKLRKISMLFNLSSKPMDERFYLPSHYDIDIPGLLRRWDTLLELKEWGKPMPPENFADLCALFGLIHSTGTWDDWAQTQLECERMEYADLVSDREAIFRYLIQHGFLEKDAWAGMREVQIGHPLPVVTEEMETSGDAWIIERCGEVQYLFPKAHAVERILFNAKML